MLKVLLLLGILLTALPGAGESARMATTSQRAEQDSVVYITREGKKYHRPDCSFLNRSKLRVSLKEAIENKYEACKRCYRDRPDTTAVE
jgi:hypothetical protein